jgi:hypothetical protein
MRQAFGRKKKDQAADQGEVAAPPPLPAGLIRASKPYKVYYLAQVQARISRVDENNIISVPKMAV